MSNKKVSQKERIIELQEIEELDNKRKNREEVDLENDVLVYRDEKYLIYEKSWDNEPTGSFYVGEILDIGLNGLEEGLMSFANKEDKVKVIEDTIKQLEEIKSNINK